LLDQAKIDVWNDLRALSNTLFHQPQFEVRKEQALRYIDLASKLRSTIQDSTPSGSPRGDGKHPRHRPKPGDELPPAGERHWLLAVAISLVLGIYFYVRRERFEEPGPDTDVPDSPADRTRKASVESRAATPPVAADLERGFSGHLRGA
jgi:hypothetical protein